MIRSMLTEPTTTTLPAWSGTRLRGRRPGRERMVPVRQEGPDPGDQGDGLIQHHVMAGGRDLDHRSPLAEFVVHQLGRVWRDDAVLGEEQRHPAVEVTQQGQRPAAAAEYCRVELPAPAAVDRAD